MKYRQYPIVAALVTACLLTGCAQAKSAPQPPAAGSEATTPAPQPDTSSQSQQKQEDVLKQFQVVLSQAQEAREATAFLDQTMKTVDAQTADKLFLALQDYYTHLLPSVNESFAKLLEQPGTVQKLYEIGPPYDFRQINGDDNFKQWLLAQQDGKLAMGVTFDESFYWKVDVNALKQAYAAYLSDDLKTYLDLLVTADQPYATDGGLKITRDELGARLLAAEKYLTDYPAGQKKAEIKEMYADELEAYIHECRYEAIDEKTMKLLPAVKQSYERLVKEQPATKTAQIVKAYVAEIKKNNDVIYSPGKKGESILGEPKANIAQFWSGLTKEVDRLLP